ncbi:MAG: CBS domain-containing protein [Deltaproteobacteria bacterium]|nr:CBS domain-containing protein [Deltaproteobacteria bacterium]MBW2486183.1 CBS domain-containing protein [Deltaproteobacteria bacterium]
MMRVKKLLDKKGHDVYSISPDATVYDALRLMAEKEVGALVVLEDAKMVGIFSERDYARKIILKGKSSKETPVREIMTSEVIHTGPDEKVSKCLSLMTKHRFRHLPVLDERRVVGMLSIEDVKGVT